MNPKEEDGRRERPGRDERRWRRGVGARVPWPLLAGGVLLGAVVVAAGIVLWRSLGDTLSGTSVARDSVDAGREPRLRLVNGPGQIRVTGEQGLRAVEYEVTRHAVASDPSEARERASEVPVDLSREGSEVIISTDGGRGTGADYEVRVPAGASVEIESEAGEVGVAGVSGDVSVVAETGDVAVRETGGSVRVEAPRGDVEVGEVNTDTGQVEAEVGSGDLELRDLVVGTLEAGVEAGDATIAGRFSGSGRVVVGTGDVIVRVPPEDTRELTLEARIGEVERDGGDGGRD